MGRNAVAISAPGKVLLAGGYLVLDRAYTGLIFGLDARIHVLVEDIPTRNGVTLSEIEVVSPQFEGAVWGYGYTLSEREGGMNVTQLRADADLGLNRNPFIETALGYALSYIASVSNPMISPASITILADNDYYSTPEQINDGKSQPRFHNFDIPIAKAPKTGLGSSAALVTSFTAAVLSHYLPKDRFDLSPASSKAESSRRLLHNLAQAAHCAAQGKVGSGFDVASAVYGSCLYRRFSPHILSNCPDPGAPGFASALRDLVEDKGTDATWDTEMHRDAVKIPKGLRLVMCDVSCGSKTPGMVKQVLAWRQQNPQEAEAIWTQLDKANRDLATELKTIAESGSVNYDELRHRFASIREGIRVMSEKSAVPIEPPSQTALIDACQAVSGVVGGVVPGAGGYDAITLLIEDNDTTVQKLEELLSGWKFGGQLDGVEAGGKVSMLGVREDMEGVRVEDAARYVQWLK